MNLNRGNVLKNRSLKIGSNILRDILVESHCCLLTVSIADIQQKPCVIYKRHEIVTPFLRWQRIGLTYISFFPCLFIFDLDLLLPYVSSSFRRSPCFRRGQPFRWYPGTVPSNLFPLRIPFQTGRKTIRNYLAILLSFPDICHVRHTFLSGASMINLRLFRHLCAFLCAFCLPQLFFNSGKK